MFGSGLKSVRVVRVAARLGLLHKERQIGGWGNSMTAEISSIGGSGPQDLRQTELPVTRFSWEPRSPSRTIIMRQVQGHSGPARCPAEPRSTHNRSQRSQNFNAALGAPARRCVGGGPGQSWSGALRSIGVCRASTAVGPRLAVWSLSTAMFNYYWCMDFDELHRPWLNML